MTCSLTLVIKESISPEKEEYTVTPGEDELIIVRESDGKTYVVKTP